MDKTNKIIRIFATHRFLSDFSLQLFFSFGALLILKKTESVTITLLFFLVNYATIVLLNTGLLSIFKRAVNRLGDKNSMALGLGLIAVSYGWLFLLPDRLKGYDLYLLLISAVNGIGANYYYILSNSIELGIIGEGKKPGSYASLFSSISVLSGITAALVVFMFSIKGHPLWSFLFCGASLLISVAFLYLLPISKNIHNMSVFTYPKRLLWKEHLACAELTHEIRNTVLPLVIFFAIGSFVNSITIGSITAVITLTFVVITGKLKDAENNIPVYIASFIVMSSLVAYAFAEVSSSFILLGIAFGSGYSAINAAFNAKIGRRLANSNNRIETSLAVDLSKLTGRIIVIIISLATYAYFGTIPGIMLSLGAVFIIPRIVYVLKPVEVFSPETERY